MPGSIASGRWSEAEAEFRILTQNMPEDLLSATQLGFLLYARGDLIDALDHFVEALLGAQLALAPQAGMNGRRCVAADERAALLRGG